MRRVHGVADIVRVVVGVVGLTVITLLAWLSAWALLIPLASGWQSVVISSGSMEPALSVGDVVLVAPTDSTSVDVGQVITFDDPGRSGVLTHRVVDRSADGSYSTRGDANGRIDSTPVEPAQIRGIGRLLVPVIGKAHIWASTGNWVALIAFAMIVVAATWTSRWALFQRFNPWLPPEDDLELSNAPVLPDVRESSGWIEVGVSAPIPSRRWRAMSSLNVAGTAAAVALVVVFSSVSLSRSDAAFTDIAESPTNSVEAAYWSAAVAIDAGSDQTCIVDFLGSAWCAGLNASGQLGDGSTSTSTSPVQVVGVGGSGNLSGLVEIGVGISHSCAVDSSGSVFCWGLNSDGQLGDNSTSTSSSPVQVLGVGGTGTLGGIVGVAAGQKHTCAVDSSGSVFCWGRNDKGQLGDDSTSTRKTPVEVVGVGGTGVLPNISGVTAGLTHSCAVDSSGSVFCWGLNSDGQLGDDSTSTRQTPVEVVGVGGTGTLADIVGVAAGEKHSCAVDSSGSVFCWGRNDRGQLGDDSTSTRKTPVEVVGVGGTGALANVTEVAAGKTHSCGVDSSGSVFCWGLNSDGQLGDDSTTNRKTPVQVLGVGGVGNLANGDLAAGGAGHSCVVTQTTGYVICWGDNTNGQLGASGPEVSGVGGSGILADVVALDAFYSHTCAVDVNGDGYCWGLNASGQLGDDSTSTRESPVQVVGVGGTGTLSGLVEIGVGTSHSCAVDSGGDAFCWGLNGRGQLGDGSTSTSNTPVQVVGVGGTGTLANVADIAGGKEHSCASGSAGSVFCWGRNNRKQLGDGTSDDTSDPVQVLAVGGSGNLASIEQVSVGKEHSCARSSAGSVFCWGGGGGHGQVGDGNGSDSSQTAQVVGVGAVGTLDNVVDIAAGDDHTCAADSAGSVFCWGRNDVGQLGDNSTSSADEPVQVVGVGGTGTLGDIVGVGAGQKHTCAVDSSGSVFCWGLNSDGQLGDDSTSNRKTPVQVVNIAGTGNLTNADFVVGGAWNSCVVIQTTGYVICWGWANDGQLGTVTLTGSTTPVESRL